ncbi:ribonuclease R [Catenovulum sp. SM1970]|uniref:ribonuclease R n=1 Tax=Marinifaba aquimaris TaxID=2741323 RepID=UPI001574C72C|nr:ribonuclease R [Marinifaba aquimaris]NTS78344.1 ribonuclease R [Marinifaba aquimaris]
MAHSKPLAPPQYHPLLAEKIAKFVAEQAFPVSYQTLCSKFDIAGLSAQQELNACLAALESEGRVMKSKDGLDYATAEQIGLLVGTVIGHREGFGFFHQSGKRNDLFIPHHQMSSLVHGDFILAKPGNVDKKGRQEVKLVRVLKSREELVVGRFFVEHGLAFVVPDDGRIGQEFVIDEGKRLGARHGQMVVIKMVKRPTKRFGPQAHVVEVLGEHMAPGMEIDIALRKYDIPHQWPKRVDKELTKIADEVPEEAKEGRVDLRKLPLVTIDGEDARDFDDAVYCERKKSGGWRLWVAIADVSYYVRNNTALDTEAENRATSVYFPEQVIPMLPEKLSNGLCSLNPHVDRLCMVCEMTVSEAGKLSGYQFYPAVMNSHCRFTYTQVGRILDGDDALRDKYQAFVPDLENLHQMYQALKVTRAERGAIEFETPEPRFIFNAERKIDSIELVVRNDAHKLIEESMILANVAAARFIEKHKAQALFRVHESPSGEKLNQFIGFLAELGLTVSVGQDIEPKHYKAIVELIQGRPDQELIQTMLLRSMKQAVYTGENEGHFGLALNAYSHFTSPIRRYPDLILHRAIKSILVHQKVCDADIGELAYHADQIEQLGEHTSMAERRADEATRDVANWLKCEFMQDHIDAVYSGVISAVTNFGFFVRLDDLHIEGLVHVANLGKDFYVYDAGKQRLIGERTRKVFKLGDALVIKVMAVNLEEKKIDFMLAAEGESPQSPVSRAEVTYTKDAQQKDKTISKTQRLMEQEGQAKPKRSGKSNSKDEGKGKGKYQGKRRGKSSKPGKKKALDKQKRSDKSAPKGKVKPSSKKRKQKRR